MRTLRKVLLLVGMSVLGALLFASVAFAQSPSASASASGCTTSPAGGGESVTACVDPPASPIASTTGGPLTPLPSDGGSPSPSASATATPTASVLPETGGPASAAFGVVSLGLLVATGIMALGLVRRG